jgi:hypothetical protein
MNKPSYLLLTLISILFAVPINAAYIQPSSVVSSGGGRATSASYANLAVIGQPIVGVTTSTANINKVGFIYTLVGQGALPQLGTLYLVFDPLGTGSGTLSETSLGLVCGSDCSNQILTGTSYTVTATPGEYALLYSLSGLNCSSSSTGGDCTFTPAGDVTITGRFDRDTLNQVYVPGGGGGGTNYTTLQAAYNAAPGGSTVMAWVLDYMENLTCGINKSIIFEGGYNEEYSSQTGYTTLKGVLTIGLGSVTVERLIVK